MCQHPCKKQNKSKQTPNSNEINPVQTRNWARREELEAQTPMNKLTNLKQLNRVCENLVNNTETQKTEFPEIYIVRTGREGGVGPRNQFSSISKNSLFFWFY